MPRNIRPAPPRISKPGLAAPLAGLKPVFVDRANETVRLVTLRPQDVTPDIADWLQDPAVMEGLNAPRNAMGPDAFRAYAASFDNIRRSLMLIRLREGDRAVGLVFLEADPRHRTASLHLIIGEAADRGHSIAFRAASLLAHHAFTERRIEKLTFQPLDRNAAAIAACERSGLKLEGILRSHRIDGRTGERLDQRVYGLTRAEFEARLEQRRQSGEPVVYEGPGLKSPA